jgi:hypothetical protein
MKKILFIISCISLQTLIQLDAVTQKTNEKITFNAKNGDTGYYLEEIATAFIGDTNYTKIILTPENTRPKKSKKHEFIGKLTKIADNKITSQEFDMYGIKKNNAPLDTAPDGNVRMVERTEEDYLF